MPTPAMTPLTMTRLFHLMSAVAPLYEGTTPRMLGDMVRVEDAPALLQSCWLASLVFPLDEETERIPFLAQAEASIALHTPTEWTLRAVLCHAALVELEESAVGGDEYLTGMERTIARLLPIRAQFLAEPCIPVGSLDRLERIMEGWIQPQWDSHPCVGV